MRQNAEYKLSMVVKTKVAERGAETKEDSSEF